LRIFWGQIEYLSSKKKKKSLKNVYKKPRGVKTTVSFQIKKSYL